MTAPPEPDLSLQAALDLLPIGAALFRGGRYVWVNRALCALLGYSSEALLRIDPFTLLSPNDEQRLRDRSTARLRGEVPTVISETQLRRLDGSWATVEIEAHAVGHGSVVLLFRDLSAHRPARNLLEGLSRLAAQVQRARNPEAVCSAALDGLLSLGFPSAVAVIKPGGYALRYRISAALEPLMQPIILEHLEQGRYEALDTCARTLEPGYIEDLVELLRPNLARRHVTLEPEAIARLRKLGIDKLALAPMTVHGRPYGVLLIAGEGLSRQTAAAVSLFAAQVGSAFEAASTIAELEQKNRRLAAINALATAGNESDPAELPERLLRIVMDATASESASVFRAGKDALELEATVNVPDWFAERYRTLPFATTVSGGAAASRKARALMLEDWPAVHHESLRRAGGIASVLLPLEVKGKLSGLLVLSRGRPERYRDEDLTTAELLADQVAVQLERARLVRALRQSYDELARAQMELVKRERLAALGELSAVIAHEVRNPLGVVFNSLSTLRRMTIPDDARSLLSIVTEESERLDRLVNDLLDFARPNEPRLASEAPAHVVRTAVETARRGGGLDGVEVRVELPDDLPEVHVDLELCRQAVLNLLLNAAQASGSGGEVVIRASVDGAKQPPSVRVDVCDAGVGIAPEVADLIFQPFFTTRASGTGLGLALVKRMAESHRTEVAFASNPGRGTTFSLWLPVERS
jgi:PAS domain S-box-containing protein